MNDETIDPRIIPNSMTNQADAQFEVYLSKDAFKFNASHFVAYPGFRERLHGHSYRASVKLVGSHDIGKDGYVLDFGCVKSVAANVCKELNEYFIVPMLSEVLKIIVDRPSNGGDETDMNNVCGQCDEGNIGTDTDGSTAKNPLKGKYPGSVTLQCEDGSVFVFPIQDCIMLPIMHSTCEELAIYLWGRLLQRLDQDYLEKRGVVAMEVTVSEAVGQDAVFRRRIPRRGDDVNVFDVAAYVRSEPIPPMPCPTETEAANAN